MENRQGQMTEEILGVSGKDKSEAEKINAKAVRLFPDGMLDNLLNMSDGESASIYTFSEIGDYYFAPRIEYKNGALEIIKSEKENLGFIVNLGGTLPQTIDENTPEFIAITKYVPPSDVKEAKSEFTADNLTFKSKATATVGNTYLIRVIRYNEGEGIFALKVYRKDTDGSIILLIKNLKLLSSSKRNTISVEKDGQSGQNSVENLDYAAAQTIENALEQQAGFVQVTVEATNKYVILRGTVPKGKMAEAVMLAQENGKRPIKNELTEQ